MNNDEISPNERLVREAERIASEVVSVMAAEWDQQARFPTELFDAMRASRLNAMTVPSAFGGLGTGPDAQGNDVSDPLTPWLVTKALARADSSSCHNQQHHTNVVHTTSFLGSDDQRRYAVAAVAEEGAVFGGWGSELNGQAPDAYTVAKRVPGGYKIYGTKLFSTNAGIARFANVFAYPEVLTNSVQEVMVFLVDTTKPGIIVDPSWWQNATGMRATVSHRVILDGYFAREQDMLGEPGDYWKKMTQVRYLPQFAANFLGVGEHVFDYSLNYLRDRKRANNDWARRCLADSKISLVTAELLLRETAETLRAGRTLRAAQLSTFLRAYAEDAVNGVVNNTRQTCGASIYMDTHPIERVFRDWQFYSRHEDLNLVLTRIGDRIIQGDSEEFSPAALGIHGVHSSSAGQVVRSSR